LNSKRKHIAIYLRRAVRQVEISGKSTSRKDISQGEDRGEKDCPQKDRTRSPPIIRKTAKVKHPSAVNACPTEKSMPTVDSTPIDQRPGTEYNHHKPKATHPKPSNCTNYKKEITITQQIYQNPNLLRFKPPGWYIQNIFYYISMVLEKIHVQSIYQHLCNKKSPLLTDFSYLCLDLEGNTYTIPILIPA
jgi:hypothetical protein